MNNKTPNKASTISQTWLLLKIQLLDLSGINKLRYSKDPQAHRKIILMGAVTILLSCMICGYSGLMAFGYASIGLADIMLTMMMVIASMITLIFTFLRCNGALFGSKDHDLIMALPINPNTFIRSKFLAMYVLNLLFTIGVLLPAGMIYSIFVKPPILFYPLYIIALFSVPFIPMVIATTIGAFIMLISSRMKHANLVTIIITLALSIGAVAASFGLSGGIEEGENTNISAISDVSKLIVDKLNGFYPPADLFQKALVDLNLLSFGLLILLCFGVFLLFTYLTSIKYESINTALTTHKQKGNFKLQTVVSSSPFAALYRKEIKRYLSCSIYVINTIIGPLLAILCSAALLFISPEQLEEIIQIPGSSNFIIIFVPIAISMMLILTTTTASSISLEGKNRWIAASLPVPHKTIYHSKIAVSLTITLPASIICSVLLTIGLKPNLGNGILFFVVPFVYCIFISIVGLFFDLKMPNYEWTNEISVVKQGIASVFTMLISFASILIPVVALFLFRSLPNEIIMLFVILVLGITAAILYQAACKKSM